MSQGGDPSEKAKAAKAFFNDLLPKLKRIAQGTNSLANTTSSTPNRNTNSISSSVQNLLSAATSRTKKSTITPPAISKPLTQHHLRRSA